MLKRYMFCLNVCLLFLFTGIVTALAQFSPPDTLWTRTISAGESRGCAGMIRTPNGYLLAATRLGPWWGDALILIDVDENGNEIGTSIVDSLFIGFAEACSWTRNGDVLIGGHQDWEGKDPRSFVLRIAPNGDTLWTASRPVSETGWNPKVVENAKGNVVVAYDNVVRLHDAAGKPLASSVDSVTFGPINDLIPHPEGGAVLLDGDADRDTAAYLVRIDDDGDIMWRRGIPRAGYGGRLSVVLPTSDGGYFCAGEAEVAVGSGTERRIGIWALKLNANGQRVWSTIASGDAREWADDLVETPDGGCAIVATGVTQGPLDSYGRITRISNSGKELWTFTFDGKVTRFVEGCSINLAPDGSYVVTARDGYQDAGGPLLLLRTTPDSTLDPTDVRDERGRYGPLNLR